MNRFINIIFIFVMQFFITNAMFCLPGFTAHIADTAGEYIYYKDNTFKRESYTGFLMYDRKTYAARYYSPAVEENFLPEKETVIYFTINPESEHLELTGEKFGSMVSNSDTEIVNYLHDMLYEFNSKRIKAGKVSPESEKIITKKGKIDFYHSGKVVKEKFPQFGGDVDIIFDCRIPLFNIKLIEDSSGKPQLEAITAGKLSSSEDNSFFNFKGFYTLHDNLKNKSNVSKKNDFKKYTVNQNQHIILDSNWNRSMENLWFYGNEAILSLNVIPKAEDAFVFRNLILLSGENFYINWQKLSISVNKDGYKIESTFYSGTEENLSRNFKILKKDTNSGYYFCTMSVFLKAYNKNRKYFDEILNGYSVKN